MPARCASTVVILAVLALSAALRLDLGACGLQQTAGRHVESDRSGRAQGLPVAQHRPGPRRAVDRGQRRQGPAEGGYFGADRRRALEDDRRRRDLGAGHRRPDHSSSVGAVAVSEIESRRRLHRHGRVVHPRQHPCRATASTSPPTRARPGRTSASPTRDAISKIRIHPTNPDIVFVAAFGQLRRRRATSAASSRRTDGGKTWQKVLFRDDKTGARRHRDRSQQPERDVRGAVGGVSASSTRCRAAAPAAACSSPPTAATRGRRSRATRACRPASIGKIGVAVSGADSNRVYALVENENGGLFSSDDAGATWKLVNDGRNIRQRAFYYTHVTADPKNKDTVYVLNAGTFRRPTAARR